MDINKWEKKRNHFEIFLFILLCFSILYAVSFLFYPTGFSITGKATSENQEQTAIISSVIELKDAEYFGRDSVKNVYNEVKELDGKWSREIKDGDYLRIVFQENLTYKNDITIYPRVISGEPIIDIYEKDGNEIIAKFDNLIDEKYNKILLVNLSGSQDSFDLKVRGGSLEFEHIIDPAYIAIYNFTNLSQRVAWSGYPTASNPWNVTAPSANASTGNYTNLQTLNSAYANVSSHGGGDYPFWRFNFTVMEANNSRADIQWLAVNVTGKGSGTTTEMGVIKIYNFSSAAFVTIGTFTTTNTIYTANYTGNINATDLIQESSANVVVYIEGFQSDLNEGPAVDFVQVNIGYYIDTEAPRWQNAGTNDSTPSPGYTVEHNINWTDDVELSFAKLEVNSSGVNCDTTANVTNTTLSGDSSWANISWAIPSACEGKTIGWKQYANDTATTNHWNVTNLQTYNVQNVAPTITLPVYTNATKYKNSQSLTFNISVVDTGIGASYCSINVDGNSNQTLAVSSGWCNGTLALTGIADGNKTINAYANDTLGNVALDNSYAVWIDTSPPTITLPVYTNATVKKSSENLLINASISDSGAGASYCSINVAGATASNVTIAASSGWCNTSYSLSGTSDGNQIINVYANDTLGNVALNNSYFVKIDDIAPTITLPVYTNATAKKNTDTLTLNIYVSDSGSGITGTLCLVDITGTNQSLTNSGGWCNSSSISLAGLSDGNKTIKVYANDTANNFALNNSYAVLIDSTVPQIAFTTNTETNATTKNQQYIFANISLTETNFKNITFILQNSTGVVNQTTYTTAITSINWTNLDNNDVDYWYNVSTYDITNNFNVTETRYMTLISNQAPTITFIYPENITYNTNVSLINYSATDDTAVTYCWYSLDEGATNSTPNSTCSNFTGLTSSQGINIWIIYANDSAGEENSDSIIFFKDTVFPQFTNYQRNISSPNEDQAIQVNVTLTETNKNYTILEFKGTTNYTVTTNVSDEYYFSIILGNYTAHDSVTYYWYANDSAGNMNKSSQQSFTVANQVPSVSAPEINDTTPETNDRISCDSGTFSDSDAEDTENTRYFRWYENDIEISGQASQTLSLAVSGLDKGDVLKCSVRVYDGYDNSSWVNSSNTATIQNSVPSITNSQTSVSWNANGSTFIYDYEATDADSDSLIWYDNSTLFDINQTGYISDTPTEAEDGIYAIRINVSDGTANATDDFSYTINDITFPLIAYGAGVENNATTIARNYIFANVSVTETNEDTITFSLYNQTSLVNRTYYTTEIRTINWTSLPNENYRYNVSVNDTSDNENYTDTRYITLDTNAPLVNLTYPLNANYTSTVTFLNYTASDSGLSYCWYSLNDGVTNSTITCGQNVSGLDSGQGSLSWRIYANDTAGNQNSSNITFFVDSVSPEISFDSSTEASTTELSRNYVQVKISANDTNLNIITSRLYNSEHSILMANYSASSPFSVNYTGLSAGTYYFNATANDTLGNEADTETRNVIISAPTINLTRPENKTYIAGTNLNLNFTASNYDSIFYNLDGAANNSLTANTSFDTVSGFHTLHFYANNSVGTSYDNVSFTVNLTKFIVYYSNYSGSKKGSSTDFNLSSYEDIQNLSNIVLENTDYGKILFNDAINITNDSDYTDNAVDFNSYINMLSNSIYINTTALPNLNKSATLYLYGLTFINPRILRDSAVCPSTICTKIDYTGGVLSFNVTQFSNYSAEETPTESVASTSPGGGGGTTEEKQIIEPECSIDSECLPDYTCFNNKCVKLFDIKIIDFQSPVKLGEFFDFTYFLKGMANISSDVTLDFWIENSEKKKITSGSDVIYIGNFEEKTESTKIFLPKNVESGIYEFYVQVSYGSYIASSHRTIELEVGEGVATLGPTSTDKFDIPPYLIIVILIILFLLSGGRLQRYKREKRTRIAKLPGIFDIKEEKENVLGKISKLSEKFNVKKEKKAKIRKNIYLPKEKKSEEKSFYKSDIKYSDEKGIKKPEKEQKSEPELIEKVVEETEKRNRGRKTVQELIDESKKIDEEKRNKAENNEKKEQTDDEYYESLFKQ